MHSRDNLDTNIFITMNEIVEAQDDLSEEIMKKHYELDPNLIKKFGPMGHKYSIEDLKYTFSFLKASVDLKDKELFLNYIRWVKVLLFNYKISGIDLVNNFNVMLKVFDEYFSTEVDPTIKSYINMAIDLIPNVNLSTDKPLIADSPYSDTAEKYLEYVLSSNKKKACDLILSEVNSGIDVKDIYLHVLQPVMHEIGRLWQTNKISVSQEHFTSAVTQLIMSMLYPYIFKGNSSNYTFVGTCVSGELHEMGIRMVSDFFELEGWDTYYLGANTPLMALIKTLIDKKPDILGISATMTYHVEKVSEIIKAVRANPHCKNIKILVGGYPFNISKDLWKTIGADGYAPNAEETYKLAYELMDGYSSLDEIG